MHAAVDLCRVLVGVARQAQLATGGGDQFDASGVLGRADLVATRATERYGAVDMGALALVLMALQTFRGVGLGIERDRMFAGVQAQSRGEQHR